MLYIPDSGLTVNSEAGCKFRFIECHDPEISVKSFLLSSFCCYIFSALSLIALEMKIHCLPLSKIGQNSQKNVKKKNDFHSTNMSCRRAVLAPRVLSDVFPLFYPLWLMDSHISRLLLLFLLHPLLC